MPSAKSALPFLIVVCSRKDEYNAQADQLTLKEAVIIQPLTNQQIEEYLIHAGLRLESLRRGLHDIGLRELLTTPLWLSVLTLAYQGISVEGLTGVAPEKLRQLIFEKYVERMLARRAKGPWTTGEIRRWLAWLAKNMKRYHLTEFSFKSVTADWFYITGR
jgi:hypothetical protein